MLSHDVFNQGRQLRGVSYLTFSAITRLKNVTIPTETPPQNFFTVQGRCYRRGMLDLSRMNPTESATRTAQLVCGPPRSGGRDVTFAMSACRCLCWRNANGEHAPLDVSTLKGAGWRPINENAVVGGGITRCRMFGEFELVELHGRGCRAGEGATANFQAAVLPTANDYH